MFYHTCLFQQLPACVKRRIKALKKIQLETTNIEAKFYEEVHLLECKYQKLYTPLYEKVWFLRLQFCHCNGCVYQMSVLDGLMGLLMHEVISHLLHVLCTLCTKWTLTGLVMFVFVIQPENHWTDLYEIWCWSYVIGNYPKIVLFIYCSW